jgi:hypothetical protein
MKLSQLARAALFAVVVYLGGTLLYSGYNQDAYRALSDYADRLETNVEELRLRHERLVALADLYRRSPDAVAVQARQLQLFENGDEVIRIDGAGNTSTVQSPGAVVRHRPAVVDRRSVARIAALVAFVLAFVIQLVLSPSDDSRAQVMRRASR